MVWRKAKRRHPQYHRCRTWWRRTLALRGGRTAHPASGHAATIPTLASVVAPVADTIGLGGMRLMRDEAFDLIRRAVQQMSSNGTSVRTSAVRTMVRELLGRDSESLSERNFTRILKDAHDADAIDLRRRGDDYEVAPAVAAAPIAAQLGIAEQQHAAVPTMTAPAPRGMAPRGAPARGRGLGTKAL